MGEANAVDIYIRLKGDAESRVAALFARLGGSGGVAMQRLGAAGGAAMDYIRAHSADLGVVFSKLGAAASWVGDKLGSALSFVVNKVMSLAKWGAVAAVAFATWEFKGAIKLGSQLEGLEHVLTIMYKSGALARSTISELWRESTKIPYTVLELAQATRQLEAFGLSAKEWRPVVADLASAVDIPIEEAVHGLGMLAGGYASLAQRSFIRYGLNLRAMPGLEWSKSGELETPTDKAMGIVKGEIQRRYGGIAMEEAKSLAGAWKILLGHVSAVEQLLTRGVFLKLRSTLIDLNQWFEKLADSPGFGRFVQTISGGLSAAFDWVVKVGKAMADAYGETESFAKALQAGWEVARPVVLKAFDWLKTALKDAIVGGVRFALSTIASDPLLATIFGIWGVSKVASAAGPIATTLGALGRLVGIGGGTVAGAGVGVAAASAARGAAVAGQVIPGLLGGSVATTLPAASQTIAGTAVGAAMGGSAVARLLAQAGPIGIAIGLAFLLTVGVVLGARGLGKNKQLPTANSQETEADARTHAYAAQMDATISAGVVAVQTVRANQKKLAADLEANAATVQEMAQGAIGKYATAEEKLTTLRKERGALMGQYAAQEKAYYEAANTSAEKALATYKERGRLLTEITRKELDILGIQDEQRQKIIEGNRSFTEKLLLMKPQERAKMRAVTSYIGGDWNKFIGASAEAKNIYAPTPAGEEMIRAHRAEAEAYGRSQVSAGYATEPAAPNVEAIAAAKAAQFKKVQEEAAAFSGFREDLAKGAIRLNVQHDFNIKLEPGEIDALIRLDDAGRDIEIGLDKFRKELQDAIANGVNGMIAEIRRGQAETQG